MKPPLFRVLFLQAGRGTLLTQRLSFVTAAGVAAGLRPYEPKVVVDTAAIRSRWSTSPIEKIRLTMPCDCCPPIDLDVVGWLGALPPPTIEGPSLECVMEMPVRNAATFLGWADWLLGLVARLRRKLGRAPEPSTC
jgi:hypothetical protein